MGEAPPWSSVRFFTPAGARLGVRAHIALINPNPFPGAFGPSWQQPGAQPMNGLNKLPPLRAPAGVVMRGSGGGGGSGTPASQATPPTKTTAADPETAFRQQPGSA